jgi:hypothetical protein
MRDQPNGGPRQSRQKAARRERHGGRMPDTSKKNPTHTAYAVRNFQKKDGEDDANWSKLGEAWVHRDGKGFDIVLEALPLEAALRVGKTHKMGAGAGIFMWSSRTAPRKSASAKRSCVRYRNWQRARLRRRLIRRSRRARSSSQPSCESVTSVFAHHVIPVIAAPAAAQSSCVIRCKSASTG